MHYRVTHATLQPGMYDQAMTTMESLRESISKIDGLVSSRLIRISENEIMGIAAYQSKEQLDASVAPFNELMSNMIPYLAAPPSIYFGDQVMSVND